MKKWPPWLALAALALGVLLAYQSAVFSSRSGDATPLYSVRRHDPYGTAALYDLLAERGVAVRTLERATLRPDDHGTLLQVVASGRLGDTGARVQTRPLIDWITQGNTVVQLTRTPTELMAQFKVLAHEEVAPKKLESLQSAQARGDAPDALPAAADQAVGPAGRTLALRLPMTLADRPGDAAWKVLARPASRRSAVVAAELRVGRGRLVIVGDPTPALNGTLGEAGDLDFLLATIGNGPVVFDEWSHDIGHQATVVGFLHDAGLLPLLLQVTFVVALFVWSTSGRRTADDAANEAAVPRGRSGAEQVTTLGHLYGRSLGPGETFDRVSAEATRRLSDALRCPPPDVKRRVATLAPGPRDTFAAMNERLASVRPPAGVRCPACGYDLRGNTAGRCPECGATVPPALRRRVAATDPAELESPDRRPLRTDAALADVLTLSHRLSQEIRSDSRAARRN